MTDAGSATPMTDDWSASDALKAKLTPAFPPSLADTMASRTVKIAALDAPYLDGARLYRAERTFRVGEPMVDHPSSWLLVQVHADPMRMLATREEWEWLRKQGVIRVQTEAQRVAYVRAYAASVGRSERRYEWLVDRVEDLSLFTSTTAMPRAHDEAEAKRARALEATYRPIIRPLSLPEPAPYRGTLFANGRGQKILRIAVEVSADARVTLADTVLENDAPIPMVFP